MHVDYNWENRSNDVTKIHNDVNSVVFMQICAYDTKTQFNSTVKNTYYITNDSKY